MNSTFSLILAVAAGLLSFGCGSNQSRKTPPQSETTEMPVMPQTDPGTTGSIAGIVWLDGPLPVTEPPKMDSEPACATAAALDSYQAPIMVGGLGELANVVVFVKSGIANYRFPTPTNALVLDQKGCMYSPRIVALMTNQPLQIRNEDPTIHNVHAMPKMNPQWNKAQRAGGMALETSFSHPELAIPFMCNVHPWMRAFVFVFDNPFYSVSSKDGRFELKNLPAGAYTIEAWQEKLGTQTQSVTIGPRESKVISFRFHSPEVSGH